MVRSIGNPNVSWSLKATSPDSRGASSGRSSGRRPTIRSVVTSGGEGLLQQPRAGAERPGELRLLAGDGREDLVAPLDEVRVRLAHDVDDHPGRLGHERLLPAEQPAVAHGPAEDPAQDVAAALVRGQDVVADEERDGARVVGDDLEAEALGLEGLGVVAEQLAHPLVDRGEEVRVVVGRDLLDDAREALQPHPGVDAGERQRDAAVGPLVELHEHEVPDLEPARAGLRVVGHALRAFREVRAAIEVDLAARAARAGLGHPPEVVVVAVVDVAPGRHPLGRDADLVAPDRARHLVVGVGRDREPVAGDAQVAGQEVPGVLDRLALEVVAEAPVPEHLEERVVARGPADLLEVVVLAGDPQAALVVHRAGVRARLRAGEDLLELDHARVREEQGLVARPGPGWRSGTAACPRSAKNSTNRRRISAAGREAIRGSGASSGGGIGRNGTERSAAAADSRGGGSGRREGQERQIRARAELLRRLSVAEDAHGLRARRSGPSGRRCGTSSPRASP